MEAVTTNSTSTVRRRSKLMREVFCDSSYFIAIFNPKDPLHQQALVASEENQSCAFVTTDAVLIETLNYFSGRGAWLRGAAAKQVSVVRRSPSFFIVNTTEQRLQTSLEFYSRQNDKEYSCTDCISMIVMRERGIARVLTSDRHFRQAGFDVLL